jgi:hypothetical protein
LRQKYTRKKQNLIFEKRQKEINMKVEVWAGHSIRFVEQDGEWWAVLKDVCDALGLQAYAARRRLEDDQISSMVIADSMGRDQETLVVGEYGIYDTVFQSRKSEAKAFRRWVYDMLATLRRQSGLEGFEVFRMLDKEHQKAMMQRLQQGLAHPVRVDFIKANTIANKAVSNRHGRARMLKKAEMTPEMLADRERILADTVELMSVKERFKLDISVSDAIYSRKG